MIGKYYISSYYLNMSWPLLPQDFKEINIGSPIELLQIDYTGKNKNCKSSMLFYFCGFDDANFYLS